MKDADRWSYAHRRLQLALAEAGCTTDIFQRGRLGTMARGSGGGLARSRHRVWLLMRRPDEAGRRPTYPDIATVCDVSHSTVIDGVKAETTKMAAGGAL